MQTLYGKRTEYIIVKLTKIMLDIILPLSIIQNMDAELNNELTAIEQAVLAAFDNEAIEMTREQRESFQHQVNAFRLAAVYADMSGFDVDDFRATITKLSGVTKEDL
jgi:hypothetical protein